jgi:hypothetical protein
MTMKREAKRDAIQEVLRIFDGSLQIRSESPREFKTYGPTLPPRIAFPTILRSRRFSASKPQTAERHLAMWPERQLARGNGYERKATRKA